MVVLGLSLPIAGCLGLDTELQTSVGKLDQATHAAATAQTAFMTAYQAAECNATNFDAIYSVVDLTSSGFSPAPGCTPIGITPDQFKLRNDMMAAIVLYADKLQALATSTGVQKVDANSQNLAKSINGFGKASGISQLQIAAGAPTTAAQIIETAVIGLTDIVLNEEIARTLREAAIKARPHLKIVVDALKDENMIIGQGIERQVNSMIGTLKLVMARRLGEVEAARRLGQAPQPMTVFFDFVQAQRLVASYQQFVSLPTSVVTASGAPAAGGNANAASPPVLCGLWTANPDAKPDDKSGAPPPTSNPPGFAKPVNDALDMIVAGNEEVAAAGPAGIGSAAQWILSCGQAASGIYTSLGK